MLPYLHVRTLHERCAIQAHPRNRRAKFDGLEELRRREDSQVFLCRGRGRLRSVLSAPRRHNQNFRLRDRHEPATTPYLFLHSLPLLLPPLGHLNRAVACATIHLDVHTIFLTMILGVRLLLNLGPILWWSFGT